MAEIFNSHPKLAADLYLKLLKKVINDLSVEQASGHEGFTELSAEDSSVNEKPLKLSLDDFSIDESNVYQKFLLNDIFKSLARLPEECYYQLKAKEKVELITNLFAIFEIKNLCSESILPFFFFGSYLAENHFKMFLLFLNLCMKKIENLCAIDGWSAKHQSVFNKACLNITSLLVLSKKTIPSEEETSAKNNLGNGSLFLRV